MIGILDGFIIVSLPTSLGGIAAALQKDGDKEASAEQGLLRSLFARLPHRRFRRAGAA